MIDYGHGGITLGPISGHDRDKLFSWRNDARVWKWCRQYRTISYEEHDRYWGQMVDRHDCVFFGIYHHKALVGCAGLTSIDHVNSRAEFSLYIAPHCQGRGYSKPALMTLFDWGFSYLNLNQIWGETYEGNIALQVFKGLGMHVDGTRRSFYYRDGKYIDCHLISMLRSEWSPSTLKLRFADES